MSDTHVRRLSFPTKASVSNALAAGWARVSNRVGKGRMADQLDIDPKTINRALTGENLPELHRALSSLLIDDSALDEVFALYGRGRPPVLTSEAANDLTTVSELSDIVSDMARAISRKGTRNHRETLAIADLIRAVMPGLCEILDEADEIRGVREVKAAC